MSQQTVTVHYGQLICLSPGYIITFKVNSTSDCRTETVFIRNVFWSPVMYRVKASNPIGYHLKGHIGFIKPGKTQECVIKLLPQNEGLFTMDKFIVMAIV